MIDSKRVPNVYFLCAGHCHARNSLTSFDGALLRAGIGNLNLIRISSILPAKCQQVEPFMIKFGSLIPIAYSTLTSKRKKQNISSAISISIPKDPSLAGVIMEHSDYANLAVVKKRVIEMGKEAMEMRNITEYTTTAKGVEAIGDKGFTTTFAGVVLWFEEKE